MIEQKTAPSNVPPVIAMIKKPGYINALKEVLPKHLTPERVVRLATLATQKNRALLNCTPESFATCVVVASQLGLEVNGPLGEAYLIPFGKECTLIIGYRGLIGLMHRSGAVRAISAYCVYANDKFDIEYGSSPYVSHSPCLTGEPGDMTGAYAIVTLSDGTTQFDYMRIDEIMAIKKRSRSGNSGPWVTDFAEMAKKGLALDTPIPTTTGWTTMGDIQVGDMVFSMNGEVVSVTDTSEVKNITCYKLTMSNGEEIICDDEHRWVAKAGDSQLHKLDFSVMTVNEMYKAKNAGLSVMLPVAKPIDTTEQDLLVDPYLLGYWLGDGSSNGGKITCGVFDLDHVVSIIQDSKYTLGAIRKDPRANAYSVGITDGLTVDLRSLGLINNKHVPEQYLRGSIAQRRALLAGLMDSDGHLDKRRGNAVFSSSRVELTDAVNELAVSLGEVTRRSTRVVTGFGVETTAHIVVWKPSFCCCTNPRKAKNYRDRKIQPYKSVYSIDVVDSVPTRCIAVTGETSTYLAGKFMTPTHNTVVKRLSKYIPMFEQTPASVAIHSDNMIESGIDIPVDVDIKKALADDEEYAEYAVTEEAIEDE